ncbi:MAG: gliding motility-associated ABC transporter substrate-binding protein GldG [Flavobacteriales bacterium]|nr:gliding motility-associated ABC transporter substrate-binding protein GldG [Flavobacteriales bacterium]
MKIKNILYYSSLIVIVILVNIIFHHINYNIDLTSDKIHSLSNESIETVSSLEEKIFINIYLEGDFPAEFKHLQNSTLNLLKILRELSNNMIDYQFIDPNKSDDNKARMEFYKKLVNQGLNPTDLEIRENGKSVNQIIFPGAILYYKEKYLSINLLENLLGTSASNNINLSIENLEYKFISSIQQLKRSKLKKIGFLEGNGELNSNEVFDIVESVTNDNHKLSYFFDIERFNIKHFELDSLTNEPDITKQINKLNNFSALIIANPTKPFNTLDKFIIDQYVMNGGKILWLVDGVNAKMDSLNNFSGRFLSLKNELNIDDLLFKYGVRINSNLIQDLRCTEIPIITGYSNKQPIQNFFQWPYFPLLFSTNNHPISKGLDAVKCEFVSSIDTIENNIKKTVLLHSSKNSRLLPSPIEISLELIKNPPPLSSFNKPNQNIAVLLEGKFESVFKNRILPKKQLTSFISDSKETKMIIVSDGDMIANKVSKKGNIFPLGYDKYIDFIYAGNKRFIINSLLYLCDSGDVAKLKSKTLKLRRLDQNKVKKYKLFIQIINILIPIILLVLMIFFNIYYRNKKYGKAK